MEPAGSVSPQKVFTNHPAPRDVAIEAYNQFNQDDDFTRSMRIQIQRDREVNDNEKDEKQKLFDQMVQEEMSKMEEYFLNEGQVSENVTGTEQRRHGHQISPKTNNNNNQINAQYHQQHLQPQQQHPGDLFAPATNSSKLGIDGVGYQAYHVPKSNEMNNYVNDLNSINGGDNMSDVTSQASISDYDLVGQVRHTRNKQNTSVDDMNQNQGLAIGMSDYAEQQRRRQAQQDYARKLDQDKVSPIPQKEYVRQCNSRALSDADDGSIGSSSFFREDQALSAEQAAMQKRQAQLAYMESIRAAADAPPIVSSRSSSINDARIARIQEEQSFGQGVGDDSTVLSVTTIGEKEIPPQSARESRRKQQLEYAQQLQSQIQQSQSMAAIESSRSRPPSGTVAAPAQSQMPLPTPPVNDFVIGAEHTSPMRQQRMQTQRQYGDELRNQITRNENIRRDRNRDPREIPDDPFRPKSNTNASGGGASAARAQRLMEEERLGGLSLGSGAGLLSAFGDSGDAERSRLQERAKMMAMADMQMQAQAYAQAYAQAQVSARGQRSGQPQVASTPTGNRGAMYSDMAAAAVPIVGATPGAVGSLQMDAEKRRQAQRQYMMQLQQDSVSKPISSERVPLRKKSNLDEDDLTLSPNVYAASIEESRLRKQQVDQQRFYHDQLLNDSTVQGVEGLGVQDYDREARQTQHQHRARYRQQMLNPQQQGLTIDHSSGQEYMTGGYDPQAVQELGYEFVGSSLPAGMGAAYAKQLKEEAERLAAEAEAKGKATGPHNWNEEDYQQRRQQQNMYAKQLADDARNAQLVMAMPVDRSTLIKPERELSGEVRQSSSKVQEYHAKQAALRKLEEDQWKASLGDPQMGSPFKTQARLDGGNELNRGVRATGYGANIGPNPVQKPYVNEDELYARAARKKSQMDYQKALQETAKLQPIEQSRESWVNEDRTQNGLPGSDTIRAAYKTQYGSFSDERQANAVNYRPDLSVQSDFQNSFNF